MNEQNPDFRPVLEIARSLREQIDWAHVRAQVGDAPFGAAFLTLVERLRIHPGLGRSHSLTRSPRGVIGRGAGYAGGTNGQERGEAMPLWAWILIIVLLVLLLTGGVGYGRR